MLFFTGESQLALQIVSQRTVLTVYEIKGRLEILAADANDGTDEAYGSLVATLSTHLGCECLHLAGIALVGEVEVLDDDLAAGAQRGQHEGRGPASAVLAL